MEVRERRPKSALREKIDLVSLPSGLEPRPRLAPVVSMTWRHLLLIITCK